MNVMYVVKHIQKQYLHWDTNLQKKLLNQQLKKMDTHFIYVQCVSTVTKIITQMITMIIMVQRIWDKKNSLSDG